MTEELITDLSKIGALKVTARFSAMHYKETEKTLAEIAEELNVEAVVEGSVLREGDRVRITTQLIQAPSGSNLWADRYERALTSILALQGEVAQAIAREIRVTLTPGEEALLTRTRQVNPEAYDAYLKAKVHRQKFSRPDLETALQCCELSLEKDRNYAPAHASIALTWIVLQHFGFVPTREAGPKVREAALKAIELDDTSAEAHYTLTGVSFFMDWDWDGAETAFRRTIELNPNYADVRAGYSAFLWIMKRLDEAMAQIERAVELDPLNPLFQALYTVVLTRMGRYDDAIEVHRSILRTVLNHPMALSELEVLFYAKGMYEEALKFGKAAAAVAQLPGVEEAMVQGYEEAGYLGAYSRAADTLVVLSDTAYVVPYYVAWYYAAAGQNQRALDWLERGFEERHPLMNEIGVALAFETLHDEPRFQGLLRRMNLP